MSDKYKNSGNLKSFIAILFVISGATGLIYQVVWFKYLGIFLGNTTYAQMIVLASFLGGLALGNNISGKRADKLKNPLLVYSALEFFIGVYCFFYPSLSSLAGKIFIVAGTSQNLSDTGGILFTSFRIILAVALLILPTMSMGATLPALSKAFISDIKSSQREMAILYGLNSLGAVFGVLFSGFFLIEYFGLDNTLYISACVNIALGISGGIVSLFVKKGEIVDEQINSEINNTPINESSVLKNKSLKVIILIAGTSGFAALLYEMVWVRLLIQVFGSSTYAFSIMLMAFISGITIGSIIAASAWFNKMNKLNIVAFSQAAIALSTVPVLLVYDRLLYSMWVLSTYLQKNDSTFVIYLTIQFLMSFITIIIPTIFMGITLPVIVSIVAEKRNEIGASVGKVFSVNTLGTVLGSVLTGLILIPWLGMRGTFEFGMFVNLAGAGLLCFYNPEFSVKRRLSYSGILSGALLLIILFTPAWNVKLTLASVFRQTRSAAPATFKDFNNMFETRKVLFYKEGTHANVCVVQNVDSTNTRVLVINGKSDASNGWDMSTQVLLGQIPMMLHNNPKEVFVVGLGSGVTVGSVLSHPVNNVHCAEITNEVIEAAGFFSKENNNCLRDKRLHMHIEDAHTFLQLSPQKYDVVISEPSNPWIAGIGNLFSKEYFELCKSKLADDGIMVQWFHVYEMNDDITRLVMNTFGNVFPNTQLWNSADGDIIMVGSKNEIKFDEEKFKSKIANKDVIKNLKQVKIDNAFTFLSTQMLNDESFYAVSKFEEINSEKHPLLEFRAPRSLFAGKSSRIAFEQDDRFVPTNSRLYIEKYLQKESPDSTQLNNAIEFHYNNSHVNRLVYSLCNYALSRNPGNYTATRHKLYSAEELPAFKIRGRFINEFSKDYREMPMWKTISLIDDLKEKIQGISFAAKVDFEEIAQEVANVIPKMDTLSRLQLYAELTNAYYKNGEYKKALEYAEKAQAIITTGGNKTSAINAPEFLSNVALSAARIGNYKLSTEYQMALLMNYPRYTNKDILLRRVERIFR